MQRANEVAAGRGSERGSGQLQHVLHLALRRPAAAPRRWTEEAAWDETLALTSSAPVALANTEDDLERELAFYNPVGPAGR